MVALSVAVLLATGLRLLLPAPQGAVPPGWHAMAALGIAMMLVFAYLFFVPYRRFRSALAAADWKPAGAAAQRITLLAKPLLWCHLHGVPELATAPLGANPFPDATPEFYDGFAAAVSRAVGGSVRVLRPYAELSKTDVLRRGAGLPLGETFSCIRPVGGRHCGRCNKCAERRAGFAAAGMTDPTEYAG